MNGIALRSPALQKFALPTASGAVATLALLLMMQALIAGQQAALTETQVGTIVDFVRLREDPPIVDRHRLVRPRRVEPPPVVDVDPVVPKGDGNGQWELPAPGRIKAPGPTVGGSGMAVPIVRIAPDYPRRAAARGIEGYVVVAFDVAASGGTEHARVLEASPQGVFERAALAAVNRYRYRPATRDGRPVPMAGLVERIRFRLDGG